MHVHIRIRIRVRLHVKLVLTHLKYRRIIESWPAAIG